MSACHTESGLKLYIKPEEIWPFFMLNKAKLKKEMCLVAENEETKYELRLDIAEDYPVLRIFYNGAPEYGQYISTASEAPSIARGLILTRLCPVLEESDIPGDTDNDADSDSAPSDDDDNFNDICQAMIDMREEHLLSATGDFISALLNRYDEEMYDGVVPDAILDSVCTILARRFKISVFRPTWLPPDENNEEVYEEYPYLSTDTPGVNAGEPSDYAEAMDYMEVNFDDGYDEDDTHLDDLPVS